jgi:DNA-directed RNA polymerase subunit RPC12/RpoP
MAEFKFPCPRCGQQIQCDTGYAGTQINCPACQQPIAVPQVPRSGALAAQPAVPAKSRTLQNVLVITAAVLVLAGLVIGGWYGCSKIKMHIARGHLPRGLAVHFAFDNSTDDSSGNGLNGSGHEITYATGIAGRAAVFNGRDSFVSVPNSAAVDLTGPFTLAAWFKFEAGGTYNPRIFHKGNSYQIYTVGTGRVRQLAFACTAGGVNGARVEAGQWTHVAGVYDGTAVYLYVNGTLAGQSPASGPIEVNGYDLTIGRNAQQGTDFLKGAINEAQIYNRALSAAEIQSIYTAGSASKQ